MISAPARSSASSRSAARNDKAGTSLNMIRWLSAHSVKESFCPSAAIAYPYMSEK